LRTKGDIKTLFSRNSFKPFSETEIEKYLNGVLTGSVESAICASFKTLNLYRESSLVLFLEWLYPFK
jgi:hypothetical protein